MLRIDDTSAHKALREAIANCLTNANYYERRGIVCVWGDEAITIANPGDFRMPIEEARKPGSSDPRNETMLKIFSFVNVGERAGSGMGTIANGWTAGGYAEPTYEVSYGPDRTTLTLPLALIGEAESKSVEDVLPKVRESARKCAKVREKYLASLSANELSVIELIGSESATTSSAIAEATGLSRRGVQNILGRLVRQGAIHQIGAGRSTQYRLTE